MGGVPGLVGLGGGAAGTSFSGPQGAQISNPVDYGQITNAYKGTQGSLANQTALLQALQAQNGLGNQSQVYGQLQGIANGTGPNPAQAMLNQSTGQNVTNQASLMAGQRGAGANVGLMARQAAQQGANTQQQAVGQGATMQANQSLNAIGAAGNMANTQAANQIGQTNTNFASQQAEQQALMNAQAQFNAAQVGMQSNINNVNGQLANTQMQGQQALLGGVMNGASSLMGASGGQVQRFDDGGDVGDYNTSTPTFGSDSGAAALGPQKSSGGSGGGMSGIMSLAALMAGGGEPNMGIQGPGPQSSFGQFLAGLNKGDAQIGTFNESTPGFGGAGEGAAALQKGASSATKRAMTSSSTSPTAGSQQLQQPQMGSQFQGQSPGLGANTQLDRPDMSGMSDAAPPQSQAPQQSQGPSLGADTQFSNPDMSELAKGGSIKDFRVGGKVKASGPNQKAKAKGNSYSNDKIPAILSEKEIVLPRSVTLSSDPVNNAAKFVAGIIAKRKKK